MKNSPRVDINSLGTLSVLDAQGKSHKLSSFWRKQRAALVFVRHFG